MLSSIRIQGKDIRRLYANGKYKVYIVNKSIFIKTRFKGEGWRLNFEIVFSKHNLAQYLKYKISSFDSRGHESNYTRISTCTDLNELMHRDYPIPLEILQEIDDFLDSTELYNEMKGNDYGNT